MSVKETTPYKLSDDVIIQRLSNFLSADSEPQKDVLERWKNLTPDNDDDLADDHFSMWQELENRFTIKDLRMLIEH